MIPAEARKLECRKVPPLSVDETLGSAEFHRCSADKCMSWRWMPLTASDPAWVAAIQKASTELNDTTPNRIKAAKHVEANRANYGLSTKPVHGYCGLDGKP